MDRNKNFEPTPASTKFVSFQQVDCGGAESSVFNAFVYHPLTKMYVKGGRDRGCNIHCTRVRFYYWGISISSIQFSERGGHFFEC